MRELGDGIKPVWDRLREELVPLFQAYRGRLGSLRVERKRDRTLLSEADIAVQDRIAKAVLASWPDAGFVAEEDSPLIGGARVAGRPGDRIWVVDPIDGTREFLDPAAVEFCSVVALLQDRQPVAAFVLAPELGPDGSPLTVSVDGPGCPVMVNGAPVAAPEPVVVPRRASVTRSAGTPPRAYEAPLVAAGCELKLRTTSQTLDMVRTCVDLGPFTAGGLRPFDLFYREDQKLWDGAAGLCLARVSGRTVADRRGGPLLPLPGALLRAPEPTLPATLTGAAGAVDWFVEHSG